MTWVLAWSEASSVTDCEPFEVCSVVVVLVDEHTEQVLKMVPVYQWNWQAHFVNSSTQASLVCQNLLIDRNILQGTCFRRIQLSLPAYQTTTFQTRWTIMKISMKYEQSWYTVTKESSFTVTESPDEAYPSSCGWVKSSSETRENPLLEFMHVLTLNLNTQGHEL